MISALLRLFSSDGYMPHGMCLLWEPNLLALHIGSDALIGLSYFSMPIALVYFARKRSDFTLSWVLILFGIFILACGTTHLFSIWTLWHPDYVLDGMIKAVTAAASIPTAAILWLVMPRALALPNLGQLSSLNDTLRQEIADRKASEVALGEANVKLVEASARLEQSKQEAQELSDRLALGTEAGGIGVWNYDIVSNTLWRDERMYELFDLEATGNDYDYRVWIDRLHPEDREYVEQAFNRSITSGVPYASEFRIVLHNGSLRTLRSNGKVAFDGAGKPIRMGGISYDVTELRQRETDAARRALERFQSIVEAAPNAMILLNASGKIEMVNSEVEHLFGYSRMELLTQESSILIPDRVGDQYAAWWRACLAKSQAEPSKATHIFLGRRKDGTEFPLEISFSSIEADDGNMVLVAIVDITERRRATEELERHAVALDVEIRQRREAETALRKSSEDFRYLFQNNPLPMWVYDSVSLHFLEVNESAIQNYGYSHDEFLSMSIADIRPPEDLERLKDNLRSETAAYQISSDWRHRRRSGEIIRVDIFSHALSFEGKDARLIVALDVTQRNAAEEQLRQSQKMDAIGQLTGGVAHDFNNLLAIMQGNLELLASDPALESDMAELVGDALKAAERGAKLTQQLLAYSRQQPLEPRVIDLDEVLEDIRALLSRTLGEAFEVKSVVAPDLWKVRIDRSQLENALINLAVNARDAMPGGGRLTIEAERAELDEHYASQNANIRAGSYVMLTVTDTGSGMSAETVSKAFEPFFTTKPLGRGTGLGLSMVYGFIKQSGGHVKIYSELGHGTSIKLYLPRAETPEGTWQEVQAEPTMPYSVKGEVVLVVEDDGAVRKLAVHLLKKLGYETIEASDGPAALEALDRAVRVDMLFTDVVMPKGLNGPALARAARARHPGLKVLYMSGYTRNAILHNGELDEGVHLLTKPFRMADLAIKIRQVLESGEAS
ncbi:MAG TPA: PAS domain S-box protein [Dongiaceae bacterium]|nr:PAS domain S-box protein [Dongiaceae bacterium]